MILPIAALLSLSSMPSKKVLACFILLFFFLFIILILSVILAFYQGKKKKKMMIEANDFNIRVYTYDYVRKRFYCFDRVDLTNVKTFNEEEFLAQFRRSDTYRIRDWLQNLINEKSPTNSLQVDIKISKGKKLIASLLHFTSINREKQIIHFESQLLPYIFTTHASRKDEKKISNKYYLKNEEDCKKFLESADADILGSILYFKFYFEKKELSKEDVKTIDNAKNGIYRIIGNYLNKNRKLFRITTDEFLIIDTSSLSKLMAMNIAQIIHTALQQYLNFNSPNIDLNIAIGVTIGTLFQGNYALGKEQAKKMADAICQGKAKNEKVLLYDETFFISYEQSQIQKEELKMLLQNGTFRLYFTPTIDIELKSQSLYLLKPVPYGTSIETFNDVINLASENPENLNRLFGTLYEKVLKISKNQNEKIRVAIEIPYHTIKTFMQIVAEHKSDIEWIICLRVNDILTANDNQSSIFKQFFEYRRNGFYIGLIIDNLSTVLKNRILKQIDYFLIPNTITASSNNPDQVKNDLRSIQATYTPFKMPLLFYGLNHIDDVETGIVNGGRIFECNDIALPSSRLEKIDEETIDYVINDAKKIAPKRIQFDIFDISKAFNYQNKEK